MDKLSSSFSNNQIWTLWQKTPAARKEKSDNEYFECFLFDLNTYFEIVCDMIILFFLFLRGFENNFIFSIFFLRN